MKELKQITLKKITWKNFKWTKKDIKYTVKRVQSGMSLQQELVIFFIRTFINEYNLLIKKQMIFFLE